MAPRPKRQPVIAELTDVQALLDRLRITRWDVLVVSDGSGTGWQDTCGWANVVVDSATRERTLLHGAAGCASVNFAEAMPTLHSLAWYHSQRADRLAVHGYLQVHVVTDSQVTVQHGTQACDLTRPVPEANLAIWAGVRAYQQLGYRVMFHWLGRNTTELNMAADLVASLSRRAAITAAQDVAQAVGDVRLIDPLTGQPIDLQTLTPDTATGTTRQ